MSLEELKAAAYDAIVRIEGIQKSFQAEQETLAALNGEIKARTEKA